MRELREVLEGLLTEDESVRLNVQVLAPIIEMALRAAYMEGYGDGEQGFIEAQSSTGVTAGVAAMVEKPWLSPPWLPGNVQQPLLPTNLPSSEPMRSRSHE